MRDGLFAKSRSLGRGNGSALLVRFGGPGGDGCDRHRRCGWRLFLRPICGLVRNTRASPSSRRTVCQALRPLPEEAKVIGTRAGGTIGRLLGGSTGYLIGGIAGAAADMRAEAKKYEQMSDAQRALLQEIRRIALASPLLVSLLMVGAMLLSWVLVLAYEMMRTISGA
jgi:hypothetical protein